jgi:hypothetical protein
MPASWPPSDNQLCRVAAVSPVTDTAKGVTKNQVLVQLGNAGQFNERVFGSFGLEGLASQLKLPLILHGHGGKILSASLRLSPSVADQLSLAGDSLEVVRNSAAITILSPTV